MVLLFVFFVFLFFIYLKNKSLAWLLVIIQLLSIGGVFFMGKDLKIESIFDYILVLLTGVLLFLIVAPWKSYYDIKNIEIFNKKKLRNITYFLILINSFIFIILFTIVLIVQTSVQDINEFKYTEGVNEDFIANNSPFPRIFLSFTIVFSNTSFFLIPLHFYYLFKKKYFLAIVCLILSFNIMLLGLTYFSRAVVIQYMFLYIGMLFLHYSLFDNKVKKFIRNSLVFLMAGTIIYFVDVSVRRFEEDTKLAKKYSKTIPIDAISQDPLVFSYLDYMSQGYLNGFEAMQLYEGEGFNGTITFEKILVMTTSPQDTYMRLQRRAKLLPYELSYSFLGFPAYAVYDYGILGSLLFCIGYYMIVVWLRPRRKVLSLKNSFFIVLLLQIPLMSIFYSEVGGSIFAFILLIPLWCYISFGSSKS
ncbi:O-antigen polymerase [Soonwooa purpurea]